MLRRQRRSSTPGANDATKVRKSRRARRRARRTAGYSFRFVDSPVDVVAAIARYLDFQREQVRYVNAMRGLFPGIFAKVLS